MEAITFVPETHNWHLTFYAKITKANVLSLNYTVSETPLDLPHSFWKGILLHYINFSHHTLSLSFHFLSFRFRFVLVLFYVHDCFICMTVCVPNAHLAAHDGQKRDWRH